MMLLCLDVGNSHIYGGVFKGETIQLRFRYPTKEAVSSDQLGLFLKSVLRENDIQASNINAIALCSVVPALNHSLASACLKYFDKQPFVLQAGVKTGLKIKYRNPLEVGADRIANAIAAAHRYPKKNVVIVDFGTATTFCAVNSDNEYLGGVIMPGMKLSMEALHTNTAKLSPVAIKKPETVVGRSTMESMQSGLYHGQLAALKYLVEKIQQECFNESAAIVIGTGGFANLLAEENLFTCVEPDLVLQGIAIAWQRSQEVKS